MRRCRGVLIWHVLGRYMPVAGRSPRPARPQAGRGAPQRLARPQAAASTAADVAATGKPKPPPLARALRRLRRKGRPGKWHGYGHGRVTLFKNTCARTHWNTKVGPLPHRPRSLLAIWYPPTLPTSGNQAVSPTPQGRRPLNKERVRALRCTLHKAKVSERASASHDRWAGK